MTYDELMEVLRRAIPQDWLYNKHKGVFTYKHDLDIRIEREPSRGEEDAYLEHWACPAPDSKALKVHYSLYYRSSLVEQFTLVEVEDGEAQLPMPHHGITLTISSKDYALAKAVNVTGRLDEYLERCDVKVV
jgi:hypothetical protein